MYEYTPQVDDDGNVTEVYRDFQNYLFSRPYGFIWNFPDDKVIIYSVAYRISSLQRINDNVQVNCICNCGGGGSGGSGGGVIAKIITDESLHGEGTDAKPLGVQISQRSGNRLIILDDGCYASGGGFQYIAPTVTLTSSIPEGEFTYGEKISMRLTIQVEAGSEEIKSVSLFQDSKLFEVFDKSSGSAMYWKDVTVDQNTVFYAVVSDIGGTYESERLSYTFIYTLFCGVSDEMTLTPEEILAATPVKVSGNSFDYEYSFNDQYFWICCPENRVIKVILDQNGFDISSAFVKTDVILDDENYTLYMFDTRVTGDDYQVTFIF